MGNAIDDAEVLWKNWNIPTFIMTSFIIQLMLIAISPFRKRTRSTVIVASTWLLYLLADWVAAQAVGQITRATQKTPADQAMGQIAHSKDAIVLQNDLFALWAQFLLLHLGGPDTITALALEDNALWLRTGLHLGTLAYSTLGIMIKAFKWNLLVIPMVDMFLVGVIRYVERIKCLFYGRLIEVDEKPEPYLNNLESISWEHQIAKVSTNTEDKLTNVEMLTAGFNLFHCYKRLYADHKLDSNLRKRVRDYFLKRSPEETYRIIETQLSFIYEATFTKAAGSHKKLWRYLRRGLLILQIATLVSWFRDTDRKVYTRHDVLITDILVIGALAVECLAIVMIQISDWSIARMHVSSNKAWVSNHILNVRQAGSWISRSQYQNMTGSMKMWSSFRRVFLARWSETIHIFASDTDYYDYPWVISSLCIKSLKLHMLRKNKLGMEVFTRDLWEFMHEVLTKPVSEGTYTLHTGEEIYFDTLLARALPFDLLEFKQVVVDVGGWYSIAYGTSYGEADLHRGIQNTIRRYVKYLYVFRPEMMFGAAGKQNVLQHNDVLFGSSSGYSVGYDGAEDGKDGKRNHGILSTEIKIEENEAQMKAKAQMKEVIEFVTKHMNNEKEKEYLIALIWVQVLCYSAISCRASVHAQYLKEGGELLSFVWLLMLHLGIGTKSQTRPI